MAVIFQTAPDTPSETVCRTFKIPSSQSWLGIFNALRPILLNPYNWERVNDTDLTIEESIAIVEEMFNEFWETEGCGGSGGCTLPDIDVPPFRLSLTGRFEELNPETNEWGEPTGEYEIPATPAREEPTAEERRCAAAANAANVMEQLYEAITDEIALGGDALQVAAAFVAAAVTALGGWIAAPLAAIIDLTIALFAGMIELLQALGADVWTEEFDDKLKCALYDCATDTGDVVTFDITCIRAQLAVVPDLLSPTIFYEYQLFAQVLFLMETITADGLNAAGATTAITGADCDECRDCALIGEGGAFFFLTPDAQWRIIHGELVEDGTVMGIDADGVEVEFTACGDPFLWSFAASSNAFNVQMVGGGSQYDEYHVYGYLDGVHVMSGRGGGWAAPTTPYGWYSGGDTRQAPVADTVVDKVVWTHKCAVGTPYMRALYLTAAPV